MIGQAQAQTGARVQQVPVVPGLPPFPVYQFQITPEQFWALSSWLFIIFLLLIIIAIPVALIIWYMRKK